MPKTAYGFKANIRLKDIIGQGLINNSNIAIMELIKNARDANSKNVLITFEKASTRSASSRLIIQDFGNGMSFDDIIHKWLNIAYSEKRGKEKNGAGFFAGDKGIGRFSCDRLGQILDIYTKQKNGELIHLNVDWKKFEIDDRDREISSVELTPVVSTDKEFQEKSSLPPFKNGTCLIIRDLREFWGKNDLEKLRKELERFIIDPHKKFEVYLKSVDFKDKNGKLTFDGVIENKLLSKLDDKTISVHSEITDAGKTIKTELRHYGSTILSFEESNPYTELKDVRAKIHYLSQAGKVSFKTITGYQSGDYSSIMFFLNGFRVMPYGEPKDDWLQLNQRKTQGTMRFLGTRELFGIVEAYDNERRLLPVSSREGLENNLAFKQLTDSDFSDKLSAYIPGVLRILEKYVVQGIDWDRVAPKSGEFSYDEVLKSIQAVIEAQTKGNKLKNVKIDHNKIKAIAKEKIAEYEDFVDELTERVSDKSAYELTPAEKRDIKKYIVRHDSVIKSKQATNKEYKETIEVEKKRRLFAESHLTSDTKRAKELQHHIGILSDEVHDDLYSVLQKHSHGIQLKLEDVIQTIKVAFFNISKIRKLSKVITNANFDMMSDSIHHDIFSYIQQYVDNLSELGASWGINITYSNPKKSELELNISPLELSMLVDNILDNAENAKAKNMNIKVTEDSSSYIIEFADDGSGLSNKYKPEDYFNAGITTTKGSGIGLNQIQQIVSGLDGEVFISSNKPKGALITIVWSK